ncbi:MAG: hypothetical protein HZC41_01725 [Chloroflexi bacterium]|nr:hypothetical protein [Chloroflexota bacterium]
MFYFMAWTVLWALVGSFGTAFLHERTGRDVTMGGLIGLVIGAVGGIFFLACLWVWLYYYASPPVGRMYGRPRKVWYRWWE